VLPERDRRVSGLLADVYNEASTLADLGDAHLEAGHSETARRFWQDALVILTRLDHPDTEQIRAKLGS